MLLLLNPSCDKNPRFRSTGTRSGSQALVRTCVSSGMFLSRFCCLSHLEHHVYTRVGTSGPIICNNPEYSGLISGWQPWKFCKATRHTAAGSSTPAGSSPDCTALRQPSTAPLHTRVQILLTNSGTGSQLKHAVRLERLLHYLPASHSAWKPNPCVIIDLTAEHSVRRRLPQRPPTLLAQAAALRHRYFLVTWTQLRRRPRHCCHSRQQS